MVGAWCLEPTSAAEGATSPTEKCSHPPQRSLQHRGLTPNPVVAPFGLAIRLS